MKKIIFATIFILTIFAFYPGVSNADWGGNYMYSPYTTSATGWNFYQPQTYAYYNQGFRSPFYSSGYDYDYGYGYGYGYANSYYPSYNSNYNYSCGWSCNEWNSYSSYSDYNASYYYPQNYGVNRFQVNLGFGWW